MNFKNSQSRWKFRKAIAKGMAVALSAAMVTGSVSMDALVVFAEETENVQESTVLSENPVQESEANETEEKTGEDTEETTDQEAGEEDTHEETKEEAVETEATATEVEETREEKKVTKEKTVVEQADIMAQSLTNQDGDYAKYVEDELVGDFQFGKEITKDSTYDEEKGFGFSKVEYPQAAKGWSGNVYYPREASVTESDNSYVEQANGALAIKSKVWTETESTGYGVYTYENSATFDCKLPAADYKVEVTFVNPTGLSYNAYVEAEDITKSTGIEVAAGESKTVDFTACLVKGNLNLKFLGTSAATSESAASEQTVYVSEVKITRLATNAAREDGKPTIFIASDSTVQSYESYYNPQTGWGQVMAKFFGDGEYDEVTSTSANYSQSKTYETNNAVVENRAIGGRSSSSFVQEGKLDDLLEDVRPGDYVLVQWGHNDSTYSRPNRYVSAADFASWMQYYIDGANQRGATPVLVTPVARYSYTTDAEGKLISYASNFEAYRQEMIKMSKEQGIALIDLTQRSIDVANSFGIDGGKSLWLFTNAGDYVGAYAGGSTDSTHLQWYGAYKFAQCVASGIVEAGNSTVYTNENHASDANKEALAKLAKLIDLRAATKAPGKIEGLTTGTVGASSVAMSWTADNESEMYHIYRAEVASEEEAANYVFDKNAIKYSVSRSAKYTDTACMPGKIYVYAVRGYNSLGLGEYSDRIVVTTKSAGLRFDFNYNNSATQAGWTGVNQNQMYDKELGYGWKKAPNNGRSRGNNGTVSADLADMAGDFALGDGEFAVDLPNGDYEVTIYAADLLGGTSTIKANYEAEGAGFGGISCKQSLGSVTGTVRVTDGQLNIVVNGTNKYINGLTITEVLKAPTSLQETEASVSGSTYTALLSFVGVEEAAGYRYYVKGTTDTEFHLERTFDKEKYALGVTEYGAISVKLGEDYQYYVTAYTADGTESAPSNVVKVSAKLNVATPQAPKKVTCIDPTASTEGVQNSITLSWDTSVVEDSTYPVLKYIVYRSDKAETDKGFKEFVKVGETEETTFIDQSEGLRTNVSYYYKVCASNAGGCGELSEVCKTPATGSLVAGQRENLTDRAVTAINLSADTKAIGTDGKEITEGVYVSWRAFQEEFDASNQLTTSFTVKVNGQAQASDLKTTNLVLTGVPKDAVITVEGSADASVNGGLQVLPTKAWDKQYLEMQLYKPADQTMPDGSSCSYTANDMSVGDVDGDGQLELIVKWYPSNAKDNSGSGYTGTTILDTYDIDWNSGAARLYSRIDLGVNIRSGAHYTQFQVWDYDGDGKAEIAVKTADGSTIYRSVDGTDQSLEEVGFVGECSAASLPTNTVSPKNDYRNSGGYVLSGPEYFTMFNPEDGTILDTVDYTPGRGTVSKWGDAYGNRVDRFLAATAYLDGEHPFAVMGRGYYTRTAITAYGVKDTDGDGIGDQIYELWAYDTDNGDGPEGQGNHNLVIADVDRDGKDEVIYGSSCYDHDGTLKYSTGMGHGDAMHVSDWVSWNDGLEVMEVHEEWNQKYQVEIHDAETGNVLIGYPVSSTDVGRGVASDIDPTSKGAEFWASSAADGSGSGEWDSVDSAVYGTEKSSTTSWDLLSAGSTPSVNATLYWDGDLLAEIQDHVFNNKNGNYYPVSTFLAKWNYLASENAGAQEIILSSDEIFTSNGTKGNLGLIADLTGDWRDEFIARCSKDDSKIRLYTTNYVTDYVIPCALDDLQYREGVAWENTAYNQPTHTSYLVSKGLVTAQLSEGKGSDSSAEILFTPANDGETYGHEITAYEIYRDGELIDTVSVADLSKGSAGAGTESSEALRKPEKRSYKFDFGNGEVQDGYTKVTEKDAYTEEAGYGFTSTDGLGLKAYKNWSEDENAALYNDCVLGWIANGSAEFKVDLPNGTYDVTYVIANGSGAVYDQVKAEEVSFKDVRRGNKDIQASSETVTVEVTDGQLNIVNTVSKNGYAALYFTGIMVEENEASFQERVAAYEQAKSDAEKKQDTIANEGYAYVDQGLQSNTTYAYQIAAVVDGKTSYLSRALKITTDISVSSIKDFTLEPVVAGTKVTNSVAELLPKTVTVVDQAGNELQASVTWDVSKVDLNTAGEYEVVGKVKGFEEPVTKTLTILANELKGIDPIADVKVIVGSAKVELPATVSVAYTNGNQDVVAVIWDQDAYDLTKVGDYTVTGTLEGYDMKATVIVKVVEDYPVSVETTSIEVAIGTSIVDALPKTVKAKMASGSMGDVAVIWKLAGVDQIDTSVPSQQMIHGTVENLDADILCDVLVTYPAMYKFDFGINNTVAADGWTTVTVNAKGGKKTNAALGVEYTKEKGYGFTNPDAVIEGRTESVTGNAIYPTNVTTDFALITGQTFVVDVPNGDYLVQVMTNCGIGSTSATVDVEGTTASLSANKSFTVKDYEVTVTDGQLTVTDKSTLARIGAIVVRTKAVESKKEPEEVTEIKTDLGTFVTGSYSMNKAVDGKAAAEENKGRIRLAEALSVEAGKTYEATVTDPSFRIIVRKTQEGKVSTFYLTDKDRFTAEEGATYMVAVHNVYNNYKDLDFAKYVSLCEEGLNFNLKEIEKARTSFETTLSMGTMVSWELGSYSMTKAEKENNKNRIRIAEPITVSEDTEYTVVITRDGKGIQDFRFLVRDKDEEGRVTTLQLSNGQTLQAKAGHSYSMIIQNFYGNHLDWTFETYYEKMVQNAETNADSEVYVFDLK